MRKKFEIKFNEFKLKNYSTKKVLKNFKSLLHKIFQLIKKRHDGIRGVTKLATQAISEARGSCFKRIKI